MKQNFIHNPLLKRLAPIVALAFVLISISLSSIADPTESSSTAEKSNRVSRLLKRLREKDSKSKAAVVKKQAQVAKPAKTEPKVKKKHKPTIKVKPEPVKISSEPAKKTQTSASKKTSLIALNKFYVRADYGIGQPKKIKTMHFKKSTMYGGGIGYKFKKVFRVDINFQLRKLKAKKPVQINKIHQSSAILNGYVNLMDESSFVIPYLTAGVGYARNEIKDSVYRISLVENKTSGKKTNTFIWNGGVGTIINISKHIKLDVAYRYLDLGNAKWGTKTVVLGTPHKDEHLRSKLHSHEVTGGLLINF
jgi:opacity protein-like surface antigen